MNALCRKLGCKPNSHACLNASDAEVKAAEAAEKRLCVDEGCPNSHIDHVCI